MLHVLAFDLFSAEEKAIFNIFSYRGVIDKNSNIFYLFVTVVLVAFDDFALRINRELFSVSSFDSVESNKYFQRILL
jgi:hypothetical protein